MNGENGSVDVVKMKWCLCDDDHMMFNDNLVMMIM